MAFVFLVLFIAIALAVIGPFVFCFALYKWTQKRSRMRSIFLILASFFLPYCYLWYRAFYPSDSFYKEEFVDLTNMPFPESGSIIKKSASFQDQHGDYTAAAQIQVSEKQFDELLQHFKTDTTFSTVTTEGVRTDELSEISKNIPPGSYLNQFSSGNFSISTYIFFGFLKDRKTIIMHRASG